MANKGNKGRVEKQEEWRDAIKTTLILKKLGVQVLAEFTKTEDADGKSLGVRGILTDSHGAVVEENIIPMTAAQARIAEVLLNRTLPVIKVVEQTIDLSDNSLLAIIAPDTLTPEAWDKLASLQT